MCLFKEVYEMYANIGLGSSKICMECDTLPYWIKDNENLRIGPVPIYHIGNNYVEQYNKIVFVASVGYGWNKGYLFDDNTVDYSQLDENQQMRIINKMRERQEELYNAQEISIYKAIALFCNQYYGDEHKGFENIALLNIINCNGGNTLNTIPADVKSYCAHEKYGFYPFQRTLSILNPTKIVGICCKKDAWILKQPMLEAMAAEIMCHPHGHPSRKKIPSYVKEIIKFVC